MIDLVGNKYGRLTVIEFVELKNHKTYWKCACDCGLTVIVTGNNLRSGNTKSCGCLHRESIASVGAANTKHNESHNHKTRLYGIWAGMRQRCNNPNKDAYKYYGGKGVKVCEEWNDYSKFKEWALSNGYNDSLSIDRIDANGNYCPLNCRWLTISENTARANKNHTTRRVIRGEVR